MPTRRSAPARWTLQDAKNKLSAVIDAAAKGVPQIVTRRGVETAVVISYEEYERISIRARRLATSLPEYLLQVPRSTSDGELIDRIELEPRDVEL